MTTTLAGRADSNGPIGGDAGRWGADGNAALCALPASVVDYDPLKNKTYQHTTLGRSVVDFLAWKGLGGTADRTLADYEWALSKLCLAYPRRELAEVTDGDIAHVLKRFPAGSRRERKAAFNEFFKWARLTRRLSENPMDLLPTIKRRPQRVIDTFSEAESAALMGLPPIDGTLMAVLLEAGLRPGEARRLRDRDIKPEPMPGQLAILRSKGGKDRLVDLTSDLARRLAEIRLLEGLDPSDFLWYSRPGGSARANRERQVDESTFHRWWHRCLDEAGVRYRNPHVTRHTFATNWLRRGGRLETLKLVLGHASIDTTADLYSHLDTRDIRADLALIEQNLPD